MFSPSVDGINLGMQSIDTYSRGLVGVTALPFPIGFLSKDQFVYLHVTHASTSSLISSYTRGWKKSLKKAAAR